MSIEIHRIQRMRVDVEPAGAFETALAIPGTFTDVPFEGGSATLALMRQETAVNVAQQYKDGYEKDVLGPYSWTLSATISLAPTGTGATNGVAAVQGAIGKLLATSMGGERLGTGDLVSDASPAVDNFDVATGARFTAGSALAATPAGGTGWEAREIESVATNLVTLKHALSGAPSNGATILNSASYFLTEDPDKSLQFLLEGAEQSNRWRLSGGQLQSLGIATPIGTGIPSLTFNWAGTVWANLGDSALGQATYSNFAPRMIYDSEFLAQVVGTVTRQVIPISTITFTPSLAFIPMKTPRSQTIERWVRNATAPAMQLQFTTPYQSYAAWFQERDDRDDYHFALQIGNSAGGMVLLTMPCGQVVNPQLVDDGGIGAQQIAAKARLDRDATDQTTEIRRSAWRVHLL